MRLLSRMLNRFFEADKAFTLSWGLPTYHPGRRGCVFARGFQATHPMTCAIIEVTGQLVASIHRQST
jgi:hypothetical protein